MGSEFDYTKTEVFNRAKLGPWEAYGNVIYSDSIPDGFGRFNLATCATAQIAEHLVALHNHSIEMHRQRQEEMEREAARRRPRGRHADLVWRYRDPKKGK